MDLAVQICYHQDPYRTVVNRLGRIVKGEWRETLALVFCSRHEFSREFSALSSTVKSLCGSKFKLSTASFVDFLSSGSLSLLPGSLYFYHRGAFCGESSKHRYQWEDCTKFKRIHTFCELEDANRKQMMDRGLCEGIKIKVEMLSPEKCSSPCKLNRSVTAHNWSEDYHDNCLELADSLTIEELRRRSKSKKRKILKSIPMEYSATDVSLCRESKRGSLVNAEPRELACDFNEPLEVLRRKLSRKSSRLKISKHGELPIPDIIVDVTPVIQKASSLSSVSQHFTYFPADIANDGEGGMEDLGGPESVVNVKLELVDSSGENMGIISGEDSPRKSLEEHSENMKGIEVAASLTKYTDHSCSSSSDFELSDIQSLKSCPSEEYKGMDNYRSLYDLALPDSNFVHTNFRCAVNTESTLACIHESAEIESLDQQNEVCNISDSSNNSIYLQSSPLVHQSYDAATIELAFVEISKSLSSEHSLQLVGESPDRGEIDHPVTNDLSSPSSSPETNDSTDAALDSQDYCVSNDSTTLLERSTCRISKKTNHETSLVPLFDVCMENEEIIVCHLQMEDDCFHHKLSANKTELNTVLDISAESSFISQGPDVSGQSLLTTVVGCDHSIGTVLAGVIPASTSGFETPLHHKEHANPKTVSMCSSMFVHCTKVEGSVGTEEFEDWSNRCYVDGECSTDLHPARVDASCSPTVSCAIIANKHVGKDTLKYHEQTPKKLLSNRKVLSPTSQERLCQAVDAEKLFESMQFSDCKKRLRYEKFGNGLLSSSEVNELEQTGHPEIMVKKAKGGGHLPATKGILKSSFKMDASLISSESENAIKFSQRQMHDVDSITEKLVTVIKSMKGIMAEALTSEAFQSADLELINKMKAATEHASYLETTAEKYLSMMTRDFKRFCKIMRMKKNKFPKQINSSQKKQRKITFADEAGKSLCHVKVFERLNRDVEVPETW